MHTRTFNKVYLFSELKRVQLFAINISKPNTTLSVSATLPKVVSILRKDTIVENEVIVVVNISNASYKISKRIFKSNNSNLQMHNEGLLPDYFGKCIAINYKEKLTPLSII